mgnify:CR=1 FL=1
MLWHRWHFYWYLKKFLPDGLRISHREVLPIGGEDGSFFSAMWYHPVQAFGVLARSFFLICIHNLVKARLFFTVPTAKRSIISTIANIPKFLQCLASILLQISTVLEIFLRIFAFFFLFNTNMILVSVFKY